MRGFDSSPRWPVVSTRKTRYTGPVSDDFISLERRSAESRRSYWKSQYEEALASGDKDAAATALRFVQEYDAFIAMISTKQH